MKSASDFQVFEKWADAPSYAFGGRNPSDPSLVPPDDKDAYWRIYSELIEAAQHSAEGPSNPPLYLRPKNYSKERGSRGHRPVDLWVSVCADGADLFGHMPQVYAIASRRGLEIGFAVSIPEDDYFDAASKERNRSIIPFINSKLPNGSDALIAQIDRTLMQAGRWHFNSKTRRIGNESGFDEYSSLGEMIDALKDRGDATGGGAAARVFSIDELADVDLVKEFGDALRTFAPVLAMCVPSAWDREVVTAQDELQKIEVPDNAQPSDDADGRRKVLAEIARRQGQPKFRNMLLQAYEGRCAMTGTNVPDTLEAAHIRPYNGPATNTFGNGILLRADIHTLFDLKLVTIDPASLRIVVSPRLKASEYWQLNGRELAIPSKNSAQPDAAALAWHFKASFAASD